MRHSEAKRRRKARKVLERLKHATNPYWKAQRICMTEEVRLAMSERFKGALRMPS